MFESGQDLTEILNEKLTNNGFCVDKVSGLVINRVHHLTFPMEESDWENLDEIIDKIVRQVELFAGSLGGVANIVATDCVDREFSSWTGCPTQNGYLCVPKHHDSLVLALYWAVKDKYLITRPNTNIDIYKSVN